MVLDASRLSSPSARVKGQRSGHPVEKRTHGDPSRGDMDTTTRKKFSTLREAVQRSEQFPSNLGAKELDK